uniref:Uncharacterized protein n=1 Tax=Anguilla anguilla TaxID=7936 RepID=A0A0E9UQE7_ANGAN
MHQENEDRPVKRAFNQIMPPQCIFDSDRSMTVDL